MLLQHIQQAFKQNLKPGLVLQALAILLVLCYYFVPACKPLFNVFGDLKSQYGLGYTMVSTALFGGFLPFLYLLLAGKIERKLFAQLSFYIALWAYQGITVDLLYQQQGHWFGYGTDALTLAKKVAIDQFIYSALYAAPFLSLAFIWKECDFSFSRWRRSLNREVFAVKIPATVVSNWFVWIPSVTAIYAMPEPLQIPLFNIVLCFWVLMLAVLNKGETNAEPTQAAPRYADTSN